MAQPDDTAERILARIAHGAHGVVTRTEALGCGVSAQEIRRRLDCGALLREHPGVYRLGHRAPNVYATYLAAVRACGNGAALRGAAAAYLLELVRGRPPRPEVITTVRRRVKGVVTRRTRAIDPRDVTTWRGVPVTTVARTVVDLSATWAEEDLARAFHEAGVRHHTTPEQVETVLARRPNAMGAAKLRRVIHGEVRVSLSKLERAFLALLREEGLELPETNCPAGGRRVDARWPGSRLTVELDSYRYHRSRRAWEQDRHREREAYARGDQLRRYTFADVVEDPTRMLAELRSLLG
jgi:predicted transcriptional regulator of viral defense system